MLKVLFNLVLKFSDLLLPSKNQVCFYITPRTSWDANQQILYAKLINRDEVVIVDGNDIGKHSLSSIFLNIWKLARSQTIIFDHSLPSGLIASRHITVNVWHGSPIKNIRFLCEDRFEHEFLLDQASHTNILVSASPYDALLMSSALHVPYFNVTKFGLPRNDYLTCNRKELTDLDLYNESEIIESFVESYKKVILFAPTYRGDSHADNEPVNFNESQLTVLERYLTDNDILLLVRSHKFSRLSSDNKLLNTKNVIDASSFKNPMILLRYTDLLVTDYSSIWIDFLLLKKPIIIYTPDLDTYTKEHGFIHDFKDSIPCEPLINFEQLMVSLESSITLGTLSEKQTYFYERYHATKSSSSSSELLKLIIHK
ncbi:CDP-glycerol glycerophosphotransferase family protein [Vibrio splendidus]|uniref:CDP-glycerol glycerophosphotransferase family protein n=1 Tax=Vibrio splendidus TaxID=29497 RepID=UPI000D3ABF7C|nr:CDP-glycerol glycerophosphotransferase family protein [Vibrio splendidus]PTP73734.1 hypothetical protein CWO06_16445 [Vibrio splendidus]